MGVVGHVILKHGPQVPLIEDEQAARRPQPRGSLPVTEKLADEVFWLTTPVDPDPAWLDQIERAFRKVIERAADLAAVTA